MQHKLIMILILSTQFVSAQTTIGWESGCTYNMITDPNSLQQAIDDGMTDIRLTNEDDFITNIIIENNISIKGGYENCADATSDTIGFSNSVINGSSITFPVIQIKFIDDAEVLFDHLTIKNGGGNNSNGTIHQWAGGIGMRDIRGNLTINHSILESNNSHYGGGIVIYNTGSQGPAPLTVLVSDTLIRQNTVTSQGGGIFCEQSTNSGDDVTIILNQGTSIRNNHADSNGGGIFNQNCQIQFRSGVSNQTGFNANYELYQNTSNTSGGGLYTSGGVIDFIGSQSMQFNIKQNQSAFDDTNSGQGGGISANGSETVVKLINTSVSSNTSNRYGAGLYSEFDATINLNSTHNCSYGRYCSSISHNLLLDTFPGGGSAMAARFNGAINILNTWINRNNSDQAAYIAYVTSGANILLEGNLIYDNGIDINYFNDNAFSARNNSTKITFAYNTLFNNNVFNRVFSMDHDTELELFGNIIKESGDIVSTQSSTVTTISCNLINSIATISEPTTDTIIGIVDFLDTANADYRLANTDTSAMDVCDTSIYLPSVDISGEARGIDNAGVPNLNGPYDLGAYEFKVVEVIFTNSFE